MAFKGTEKRSALQIAKKLKVLVDLSMHILVEKLHCYYAKVLKNHLPLAVDILSDIISNSYSITRN